MLALFHAAQATIDKTKAHGIALVSVTDAWMSGRSAYYVEMIAKHRLVAIHAAASSPQVAPPGGLLPALGLLGGSGLDAESEYGYLFVAFRPDLLGPADAFERQVTQLIERIKATPRQPGIDAIRIPSERAFRSRERARRDGLEIDRMVFDALVALRARQGIAPQ